MTRSARKPTKKSAPARTARNKRQDILTAGADRFARQGYEDTMWADIAADVGIGSTALYHYFESKLHCLLEIMSDGVASTLATFDETTQAHERFNDGFPALVRANFALTEKEMTRCRVLVAEQGRLSQTRTAEKEEQARQRARTQVQELETGWSDYLSRAMAAGEIPKADALLLARAALGLYNSIWHWYRPQGALCLAEVEAFYTPRLLSLVGLSSD